MPVEIESKMKVSGLAAVERKLREIRAVFRGLKKQSDAYFDDSKRKLTRNDCCLRIRSVQTDDQKHYFLTYKGPKQHSRLKKRTEIEMALENPKSFEKLLWGLGFAKMLNVNKKRSVWIFQQCEIALDRVSRLGSFVEIEGPNVRQITKVKKMLELDDVPDIKESYAALLEKKMHGKTLEP